MRTPIALAAGMLALVAVVAAYALGSSRNPGVPEGAYQNVLTADGRMVSLPAVTGSAADDTLTVTCEPGQRAVVQRTRLAGRDAHAVECVTALGYTAGPALAAPGFYGGSDMRIVRASDYAPAPVVERRVVYRDVPERRRATRSWQKSALIIGSSAGAGAGIGALVGGKKGALIGAAIGGGAGTVYDQATRRR